VTLTTFFLKEITEEQCWRLETEDNTSG